MGTAPPPLPPLPPLPTPPPPPPAFSCHKEEEEEATRGGTRRATRGRNCVCGRFHLNGGGACGFIGRDEIGTAAAVTWPRPIISLPTAQRPPFPSPLRHPNPHPFESTPFSLHSIRKSQSIASH